MYLTNVRFWGTLYVQAVTFNLYELGSSMLVFTNNNVKTLTYLLTYLLTNTFGLLRRSAVILVCRYAIMSIALLSRVHCLVESPIRWDVQNVTFIMQSNFP